MFVAFLAIAAAAAAAAQAVDPTRLGPQVGETVPAFALTDHRGVRQDLASLSGRDGLMLVFFRSADW
jgi:hypothetical protein